MARKSVRNVICIAGFLAILAASQAQAPKANTPHQASPSTPPAAAQPAPSAAHPLTSADLEAFFDGILPMQLERSDIAGATVLVMQNGNVLLEKGYGYADLKTRRPVDPATTLFRLASISKLFTWISIMQLEEQGKVNLDADINRYLDFTIRPAFNKPITLRDLMTHTAGFEETFNDLIFTDPRLTASLRDYLIQNQPMRMYPPGQIPAYSNYGVGLGGYIVQRVSGEPFQQYVQEHIFAPLGMTHSSFYEPLPSSLIDSVSQGYLGSTIKPPMGFEIVNPINAGGSSSTAADMGRFGQALLNGGELDGKRILQAATLAQMWTPQFRATDQLPAICMGFYQAWRNHLRWIGHDGDLVAFHSMFFLEPQQKIVLFVSYNSRGGAATPRTEILNAFSDRYFPGAPPPAFLTLSAAALGAIDGRYQTTRRADTTRLKPMYLLSQVSAHVDRNGVLTLQGSNDLRGHPIQWKPIGQDLWQAADGQQRLFAIRDSRGRVVRIASDFPASQLQRVPWYENSKWVLPVVEASLGILVLVIIATLIRTGRRLFLRKRSPPAPQPGTAWLPLAPRLAAFVWVLLLGSIAVFLAVVGIAPPFPTSPWFKWYVAIDWVTALALLLSLFTVTSATRIWWRSNLRWITKVKFSLVGLACLILSWFAIHWHLIGPTHRI